MLKIKPLTIRGFLIFIHQLQHFHKPGKNKIYIMESQGIWDEEYWMRELTMSGFMKTGIWQIIPMVAPSLRSIFERMPTSAIECLEEIRLRRERPLAVRYHQEERFLSSRGQLVSSPEDAYKVSADDILKTLQLISQGSLYAYEEELRQGFITLPGGHRVGLAGRAVLDGGVLKTICDIGSLNIRIARAVPGAARRVLPFILDFKEKRPYHTLLVSPPGAGKTTILRDLVRSLSYGLPDLNFPGLSVGVVDERSELAACFQGVPQHDLGPRVDVLDCCPKAVGMVMLLRSMAPQVIATDEIGRFEDVAALWEMVNTGVSILATAHASTWEELEQRPSLRELIEYRIFRRYVFLSRRKGPGTIEGIWDENRNLLRGVNVPV